MSDCCSPKNSKKDSLVDVEKLEGLICYCFKKSKQELFDAVKNGTENLFVDDIKSKMKNPNVRASKGPFIYFLPRISAATFVAISKCLCKTGRVFCANDVTSVSSPNATSSSVSAIAFL